jgi:hypothetical protein
LRLGDTCEVTFRQEPGDRPPLQPPAFHPTVKTSNRLRVVAVVLAVLGVGLCALALAGRLLHSYYVLRPWLDHPVIFGATGCLALAAAWGLGIGHAVLKPVGMVLFAMAGAGVIGLSCLASAFDQDLREVSRHPAPDGSMELIVYSGSAMFAPDPTLELRLHTRNGLLSRERDLGCVNLDSETLSNVEWVGPRTVRAHLFRGEMADISLSESGRPDRQVECGC